MPAAILSGFAGAMVGGLVTLLVHRSDRSATRLVAMEARLTTRLERLDADVNNLGRKVSGVEILVNAMLDHPERFSRGEHHG